MSACPQLRPDVVVRKLTSRGDAYVIVKDPRARQYYKFEDWEYELLELLDGTRSAEQIARDYREAHPGSAIDPQYVLDYVEELRRLDVLERSGRERHLMMLEKLRAFRKRRLFEATSVLQIRFPLWDPDPLLDRVIPWIRWLWSPWMVLGWLVVFGFVLSFLFKHGELYWSGFLHLWNFSAKDGADWVGFFALLFGVSVWHELGHGLTCKRYGGEVHDVGIMLFYFQPVFYCGIDDSYLFPRQSHRVYAALGGVYFELMMCAVAMAVWLLTPAEWWIHTVALTVVFFTGLSAIVFNMNPLIKYDAYYVLMDWLDVPNLREESFAYVGRLLKGRVFRLPVAARPMSRRRRKIYLVYGLLSVLYTAVILLFLFTILRLWLGGMFGAIGVLLTFAIVGYLFRGMIRGGVRFVRHFYLDKRERLRSWRNRSLVALVVLAAAALVTLPRFPTRVDGSFVVEPGQRAVIRTPAAGVVQDVRVHEGMQVAAGQLLARVSSPELEAASRIAASEIALAQREFADARRRNDAATAQAKLDRVREAEQRLALLTEELDSLALTAPLDGVISTTEPESFLGRFLAEGEELCRVDRLERVRLEARMSELDIGEIETGMRVRLLPTAFPYRPLDATVLSLAPVATPEDPAENELQDLVHRTNLIGVYVVIANPELTLRPGMTGRFQVLARPRSVAGGIWWRLSRWTRSLVW